MLRKYGADVARRIDEIIDRDGACTPAAVVEDGASPDSPFHAHLEWDDRAAAHAHRIDQARAMIRWFRVVEAPDAGVAREPVYVHVAEVKATDVSGYVRRNAAMADPALRDRYLRSELARIAGLIDRVAAEPEFLPIVEAVEEVRAAFGVGDVAAMAAD